MEEAEDCALYQILFLHSQLGGASEDGLLVPCETIDSSPGAPVCYQDSHRVDVRRDKAPIARAVPIQKTSEGKEIVPQRGWLTDTF